MKYRRPFLWEGVCSFNNARRSTPPGDIEDNPSRGYEDLPCLIDNPSGGYEYKLPVSSGSYQAHMILPGLIRQVPGLIRRDLQSSILLSAELTLVWGLEVIKILEGPPG